MTDITETKKKNFEDATKAITIPMEKIRKYFNINDNVYLIRRKAILGYGLPLFYLEEKNIQYYIETTVVFYQILFDINATQTYMIYINYDDHEYTEKSDVVIIHTRNLENDLEKIIKIINLLYEKVCNGDILKRNQSYNLIDLTKENQKITLEKR